MRFLHARRVDRHFVHAEMAQKAVSASTKCRSAPCACRNGLGSGVCMHEGPDPNLPRFLYGINEDTNIDTDSDMLPAQCAWCRGIFCNGTHLSYCSTWRNLSVELNLELPQQLRVRHIGRSMRPML